MQLRSILVALALGASSAFMRPASVSRVTARFSVEDKLKEIVAEQFGVEQSSITPEASFASDLGADSLDVVEMVMKIEEFNVELPDERAEEVQNLSDAVRVVTERRRKWRNKVHFVPSSPSRCAACNDFECAVRGARGFALSSDRGRSLWLRAARRRASLAVWDGRTTDCADR